MRPISRRWVAAQSIPARTARKSAVAAPTRSRTSTTAGRRFLRAGGRLGSCSRGVRRRGEGHLRHQLLEGGVAGAEQIYAEFSQPKHYWLGIRVLPGVVTGKKPGSGDGASRCTEIGSVVQMVPEYAGEGFGNRCGFLSEGYAQFAGSQHDCRHFERGNPCRRPPTSAMARRCRGTPLDRPAPTWRPKPPGLRGSAPCRRQCRADFGGGGGSGRLGPVLVVLGHNVGRAEDRSTHL
jgi:hypothetical protein